MGEFIAKYWLEFAFGIITAILSGLYARLAKRFKAEKLKNQAIENGVRDILRMQILDSYDKCKADGCTISISRKDAIDSAYKSYSALGGNGTITRVHEEIMEMPIK
ncbi:MAG: hypothetical protein IKE25_03825 [Clostridia bacterium]|jgi:hypothetical protein|nr:hypothetical protein [Clostridia bacterium]